MLRFRLRCKDDVKVEVKVYVLGEVLEVKFKDGVKVP